MEHETSSLGTLARSVRAALLAAVAAVTIAAWTYLALGPAENMHSALMMPNCHRQATVGTFVFSVAMWLAMTIAMMSPTTLNWLFAFAALVERSEPQRTFRAVSLFAAGYFAVWLGYSVLGAGLQFALLRAGQLNHHGMLGTAAGGLVLMGAGLIYFTPLSRDCLKHCRNPLTYFLGHWKNGPRSGFQFGAAHGFYCVGCCWALMLTGFAMGTMNLVWMGFLTVLVCIEKLVRHGDRIAGFVAAGMIVWGAVLVF